MFMRCILHTDVYIWVNVVRIYFHFSNHYQLLGNLSKPKRFFAFPSKFVQILMRVCVCVCVFTLLVVCLKKKLEKYIQTHTNTHCIRMQTNKERYATKQKQKERKT